jgi:endonuclease III
MTHVRRVDLAALAVVDKAKMREIMRILRVAYPDARCSLHYESPFQLLCATILSAQCTDERVNKVTPVLFAKYPDAREMAKAPLEGIAHIIRSTGFFRSKSVSLKEMSRALVQEHGGEVPADLEKLVKLRGVGRKTANVVLGNVFGVPGLVVDTHVGRISRRLGFTSETNPVRVELDMKKYVPRKDWTMYGHLMIAHGRLVCRARKALCRKCPVSHLCPKIGV